MVRAALGIGAGCWVLAWACGEATPAAPGPPPPLPEAAAVAHDARREIEAAHRTAAASADPEPRLAHAQLLDANGLHHLALEAYDGVLVLAPHHALAHYHRARTLAELGREEEALEALGSALEAEPNYGPGHRRRGFLLLSLGRLGEADAAFERCLSLLPGDAGARLGRARVALERSDPAAAADLAHGVVTDQPGLGYARHLWAAGLRESGRLDQAAAAARGADGEVPTWPDAWEREVRVQRGGPRMRLATGRALLAAGRGDEARRLLEGERAARPDDPGVLGALAATYCELGAYDRALSMLAEAEARNPRHNRIALIQSEVHAAAGDLPAAVERARRAVELQPDLALGYQRLAALLQAVGDADGAREARDQARRLGAESP